MCASKAVSLFLALLLLIGGYAQADDDTSFAPSQNSADATTLEVSSKSKIVINADDESERVVMGSRIVVSEDEYIEELMVIAGQADIKGQVGHLVVLGGSAHLYPTSVILKELAVIGGHLEVDEGAQIHGQQVEVSVPLSERTFELVFDQISANQWFSWLRSGGAKLFFAFMKLVSILIFAAFGYYVAPFYQRRVESALSSNFVLSFLWGVLSLLLVLPLTVVLTLSIVGIPLLPLQFSLLFLFVIFGHIHIAKWMTRMTSRSHEEHSHRWGILVLGLVGLELIGWIPVVGLTLKWALVLTGFGAASRVFYGQILRPPHLKKALDPVKNATSAN